MEGEIRSGLVRLGIARELEAVELRVSSRTDRGVSARGNALTLSSRLPPTALLRALNGVCEEIRFTHLAEVPEGFRVRAARQRWYRYWEREADEVPESWVAAAREFAGRVDARSFGRGLPADHPTWRDLDGVEPSIEGGWLVVDVRARSFVWGMVRKVISALRAVEGGTLAVSELRDAIGGRRRLALPLAEPDRLVLWETTYPVPWTVEHPTLSPPQARHLAATIRAAAARREIWSGIWAVPDPAAGGPRRR